MPMSSGMLHEGISCIDPWLRWPPSQQPEAGQYEGRLSMPEGGGGQGVAGGMRENCTPSTQPTGLMGRVTISRLIACHACAGSAGAMLIFSLSFQFQCVPKDWQVACLQDTAIEVDTQGATLPSRSSHTASCHSALVAVAHCIDGRHQQVLHTHVVPPAAHSQGLQQQGSIAGHKPSIPLSPAGHLLSGPLHTCPVLLLLAIAATAFQAECCGAGSRQD